MSISLFLGNTEMDTAHQQWSHKGWVEGKDHLLQPACGTLPNATHSAVCLAQPVKISLKRNTIILSINNSSQFCMICDFLRVHSVPSPT